VIAYDYLQGIYLDVVFSDKDIITFYKGGPMARKATETKMEVKEKASARSSRAGKPNAVSEKNAYIKKLEDELKKTEKQINEFKKKKFRTDKKLETKYKKSVEILNEQKTAVKERLKEAKASWRDITKGIESAWKDLRRSIEKAKREFK
jgi:uncharacterized protein (DUF342 family)